MNSSLNSFFSLNKTQERERDQIYLTKLQNNKKDTINKENMYAVGLQ